MPLLYAAPPISIAEVVIRLRFSWPTSFTWQPPQVCTATRRSPGLRNRTNSGDSWFRAVYVRSGFPERCRESLPRFPRFPRLRPGPHPSSRVRPRPRARARPIWYDRSSSTLPYRVAPFAWASSEGQHHFSADLVEGVAFEDVVEAAER